MNEALRRGADSSIVDYLLFLKGEIALRATDYEKAEIAFDMLVDQYPSSVWYSSARNRLAAIPSLPSPSAPSSQKKATPAKEALPPATTTQASQPSENTTLHKPQAPASSNSPRPLAPSGAESRPLPSKSAETSVRLPSATDLRERAENSIPQELRQPRSSRNP